MVGPYLIHDVPVCNFGRLAWSHQTAYEPIGRCSAAGQEDSTLLRVPFDGICCEVKLQPLDVCGPLVPNSRKFSNCSVHCRQSHLRGQNVVSADQYERLNNGLLGSTHSMITAIHTRATHGLTTRQNQRTNQNTRQDHMTITQNSNTEHT